MFLDIVSHLGFFLLGSVAGYFYLRHDYKVSTEMRLEARAMMDTADKMMNAVIDCNHPPKGGQADEI